MSDLVSDDFFYGELATSLCFFLYPDCNKRQDRRRRLTIIRSIHSLRANYYAIQCRENSIFLATPRGILVAEQLTGAGNMSIRVISLQQIYGCFLEFKNQELLRARQHLCFHNRCITYQKKEKGMLLLLFFCIFFHGRRTLHDS